MNEEETIPDLIDDDIGGNGEVLPVEENKVELEEELNDCVVETIENEDGTITENLNGCGDVSIIDSLEHFYKNYLIETPEGFFQVFRSLTYGEMLISFLLLLLVLLFCFKWLWEVLR